MAWSDWPRHPGARIGFSHGQGAVAAVTAALALEGALSPKREMRGSAVTTGALLERESSLGIILMLPGALLLMVFMAYPFFLGIWLSLTDSAIGRGLGQFRKSALIVTPLAWPHSWACFL